MVLNRLAFFFCKCLSSFEDFDRISTRSPLQDPLTEEDHTTGVFLLVVFERAQRAPTGPLDGLNGLNGPDGPNPGPWPVDRRWPSQYAQIYRKLYIPR